MNIRESEMKKILVIALNNIGDVILNTAAISLLRDHFPESNLSVLVGRKAEPVLKGSRLIDQIVLYDKHASWWGKLKLVSMLRKERFDLVIDLKNTAIPFLIGPRYRTPFGLDRSLPLMREQHLSRLKFLIPVTFEEPNRFDFFLPEEEHSVLEKFRERIQSTKIPEFVVLAPGARMALKRWTISGFSEVGRYWVGQGKTVAVTGGPEERALADEMERLIGTGAANLVSELTLRETAALIHRADLVVANDSAILHLALELDRPVVGLFGPTDEAKCGRRGARFKKIRLPLECAPCELARCKFPRRMCLDDLPAETVIQACEELFSGASH